MAKIGEVKGGPLDGAALFDDSPDASDPECVCSACGKRMEIDPEEDDYEMPIRMWPEDSRYELRFHARCLPVAALFRPAGERSE